MPSLVPGYEYDIFISYRHNDNRSGWPGGKALRAVPGFDEVLKRMRLT